MFSHSNSGRKYFQLSACLIALTTSCFAIPQSSALSTQSAEAAAVPNSVAVHGGFAAHINGLKITVMPGNCWVNDHPVQMKQARVVDLPPCNAQQITAEAVTFGKDLAGVNEYLVLPACIANKDVKLGVQDSLATGSLVLRAEPQSASKTYVAGKDYTVTNNGVVRKVKGGALQGVKTCYATYSVNMHRVDSIAVDESGNLRFATGKAAKWAAVPPAVPSAFLPLYNVYSYTNKPISAEDILGVSQEPMPIMLTKQREKNRDAMKEVLDKLKQGKSVRIAFWGDSITYGTGASSQEQSYVSVFTRKLKQLYPKADIVIDRQGLVNANTSLRSGTLYQDVLAKQPDLVVIEFLNDMLFPSLTVGDRYVQLFKAIKMVKSDVLVIAPHLPSPNFVEERSHNGYGSLTYTDMLRTLVHTDPNAAICDVAARWQHLPKEGLKRESLMVDGVHPSDRGHEIYAEELIKLFQ